MIALRAFLIGYGIAAIAGAAVGGHCEYVTGLLTAWTGGAILSLLVAYTWFIAMTEDGLGNSAAGNDNVRTRGTVRLVKVWDRDLA